MSNDLERRSTAIQRLRSSCLYVSPAVDTSSSYRIARDESQLAYNLGPWLSSKSVHLPRSMDDFSEDWPWIFSRHEWIPGPGLDDFTSEHATIEDAVEAVLRYYFGKTIIIEGWSCFLHLHPELQADKVRSAIGRAKHVTADQFNRIDQERSNVFLAHMEEIQAPMKEWWQRVTALSADALVGEAESEYLRIVCDLETAGRLPPRPARGPSNRYEWALQSQFLPIEHAQEPSKALRLRRDLQEAYIISE